MHDKTSVFLAEGIVIASAIVLVAVLVIVFSPLLWSDHLVTYPTSRQLHGCTIQSTASDAIFVAHCPFWTQVPS